MEGTFFISVDVSDLVIYNRFSGTCCSSGYLFLRDVVPHKSLSVTPRGPLSCNYSTTPHRMLCCAPFSIFAGWVRVCDARVHGYLHYLGRRCRKHMGSYCQRHAEFAGTAPERRRGSFLSRMVRILRSLRTVSSVH